MRVGRRWRQQRLLPRLLLLLLLLLAAVLVMARSAAAASIAVAEAKEEAGVLSSTIEAIKDGMEDLHESVQEARANVRKAALDLHENISDVIEDSVEDVRGYLGLEVVEEGLEAMKRRTKFVRRIVLKGVVGVTMLLYGLHFSHLVVFAHTVRVTGWPVVTRAWNEVLGMYFHARTTIKKEFPVIKARKLAEAVHYEVIATRKILKEAKEAAKDGTVTKAEAREAVRKAHVNLQELNQKSFLINQSLSSMSAVVAAINIKKVKELLQGVYTSALACFAAASSSTLRGLSIGFDLAALISRHIDHAAAAVMERIPQVEVFKVLPKETQKVLGVAVGLVSIVKGLFVIHFVVPKMTLALSSSALGAMWITDALAEVADQRAGGEGLGALSDKALNLCTNLLLVAVGVGFQSSRAGDEMPAWARALLYPAVRLEEVLRSLDGAFGAGRERLHRLPFFHKQQQPRKAVAGDDDDDGGQHPARWWRRFHGFGLGFGGFGRRGGNRQQQ